ncbi:MAG: hypothetical protein M1313_10470 [Nitrospirae bacterium]|nr:hypothetical protein [Nitrospirota bacterium]
MRVITEIKKMWTDARPIFFILAGVIGLFLLLFGSMMWGLLGKDSFSKYSHPSSVPSVDTQK